MLLRADTEDITSIFELPQTTRGREVPTSGHKPDKHLRRHVANVCKQQTSATRSGIERAQGCILANTSGSRYVVIATQPVHRLQIRPILHN